MLNAFSATDNEYQRFSVVSKSVTPSYLPTDNAWAIARQQPLSSAHNGEYDPCFGITTISILIPACTSSMSLLYRVYAPSSSTRAPLTRLSFTRLICTRSFLTRPFCTRLSQMCPQRVQVSTMHHCIHTFLHPHLSHRPSYRPSVVPPAPII